MKRILPVKPRILELRESPGMGGINSRLFLTLDEWKNQNEFLITHAVLGKQKSGWLFDKAKDLSLKIDLIHCEGPRDFTVLFRIRDYIINNNIDLVHTHGYRANFYVRTCIDLGFFDVPVTITKHGIVVLNYLRKRLYQFLDIRPTKLANRVITVDSFTLDYYLKLGVKEEKLRLIPNPIKDFLPKPVEDILFYKKRIGISNSKKIILYSGRFEQAKGVYDLIKAYRIIKLKNKNSVLLLIGEGPDSKSVERLIADHFPLGDVIILPPVTDLSPYIQMSYLVVLPSYSEGMPLALLEAMAAKKPLVATKVGGIPSILRNDYNGLLISPGNPIEMANAILNLLNNEKTAEIYGKNGYELAWENHNPDKIVNMYKKVYRDCLN